MLEKWFVLICMYVFSLIKDLIKGIYTKLSPCVCDVCVDEVICRNNPIFPPPPWLIFKLAPVPLISLEADLYGLVDREMAFMLVKS